MRTAGAQDSMGTDPFLCISAEWRPVEIMP